MNNSYIYNYKVDDSHPFDIKRINNACDFYAPKTVLVELPNTKGISSYMIRQLRDNVHIRIAGGYDEKHLRDYANTIWKDENYSETTQEFMYEAVIYSRNETIRILEQLEKLDRGILKSWTPIQQIIYTYDYLKKDVMYDPKYKTHKAREVRSLRGLLTKKTVCAGYSLMFKEVMDRHNIKCEFAIGNGHAWNIINLDGRKYPIDLTWDNEEFRAGNLNSLEWLTKSPFEFSLDHQPFSHEETQDYVYTLSRFDPKQIENIWLYMGINRQNTYRNTTFLVNRGNKQGRCLISTVGKENREGKDYYKYFYMEILPNGQKAKPRIFYSETNISRIVDAKEFGQIISQEEISAVINGLLSKKNIDDSLFKGTQYLGDVRKGYKNGRMQYISKISEIQKPPHIIRQFENNCRTFLRNDGTFLIAQKLKESNLSGVKLYRYELFELIGKNGYDVVKRNTVFTEDNLLEDTRSEIPNILLDRRRLDRKEKESGGYIGYYDNIRGKVIDYSLNRFFNPDVSRDINTPNEKPKYL